MKKLLLITLMPSFFTAFATTVNADDTSETRTQAEQQIEAIKARLNLTEQQKEQITPILQKNMEKRQSILKNYGIDHENLDANSGKKIGFSNARKLKKEMNEVRSYTLSELQGVLTDAQLIEYREVQEEISSKMRNRIKFAH